MANKYKRYALRVTIFLYVVYMAIAAFGQHQSYMQLFFGVVIGLGLFGAGRIDKELEAALPNVEEPVTKL